MWKVFIFIFTLSHRQSQVDRDFSINKKIVIENLHSSSLSAQWIVYDYLKASKKNIHDIKITIKMLTSCKGVELLTSLFVLVYTVRQKVFDIKSFIWYKVSHVELVISLFVLVYTVTVRSFLLFSVLLFSCILFFIVYSTQLQKFWLSTVRKRLYHLP